MQTWEDDLTVSQRETDFQQRVLASSLGPIDPTLYWRIFDPDHMPAEEYDDNDVFFPTSEEDFAAMISEWEAAEAET